MFFSSQDAEVKNGEGGDGGDGGDEGGLIDTIKTGHGMSTASKTGTEDVGEDVERRARVASEDAKKRKAMTEGSSGNAKGLMQIEEKNVGSVPLGIYVKYLRAAGGLCMFAFSYVSSRST